VPENPVFGRARTLNSYSRMALAVRGGWGFEVVLSLGGFLLWRIASRTG
jgi:hypothetical protein